LGALPSKKLETENMQNLGQFHTTSEFDREYLRNRTRYPKSERHMITSDSSRVPRKKSGELWSTNYRVVSTTCEFGPTQIEFFDRLYFGPVKVVDQLQPLPRWAKKVGELWSTNKKVIGANVDPPMWNFGAISNNFPLWFARWRCCERHLNHPKLSLQSGLRRRVAFCWALPHISSLFLFFFCLRRRYIFVTIITTCTVEYHRSRSKVMAKVTRSRNHILGKA